MYYIEGLKGSYFLATLELALIEVRIISSCLEDNFICSLFSFNFIVSAEKVLTLKIKSRMKVILNSKDFSL
jgi:hypothetical protein